MNSPNLLIRPTVRFAVARHFSQARVAKLLAKLASAEKVETRSGKRKASLLITNDREIRRLNRQYRGKDKATDVLSFPLSKQSPLYSELLGDLVISWETTTKQARQFGTTISEEFLRLLVHGFLHLCGYDHENVPRREVERMQKREELLWNQLRRL